MRAAQRPPPTNLLAWRPVYSAVLFHVLAPLLVGAGVYVIHRSTDVLLWRWMAALGFDELLASIRAAASPIAASMPTVISNVLPAIAWSYAFVVAVGLLWVGEKLQRRYVGLAVAAVLASEAAQAAGLMPGTFDWQDVGAYLLGLYFGVTMLTRYGNEPEHSPTQHLGGSS